MTMADIAIVRTACVTECRSVYAWLEREFVVAFLPGAFVWVIPE
jgi:hypothetical protein